MNGWVPLTLAAEVSGRPVKTLRTWARRMHLRAACRVQDRSVVVWWPDVYDRQETRS